MSDDRIASHLDALTTRHQADVLAVAAAANDARSAAQSGGDHLRSLSSGAGVRSAAAPTLGGMPVDELPPYVPPQDLHVENALIPDTPLLDGPVSAPAFDDAPLWQN